MPLSIPGHVKELYEEGQLDRRLTMYEGTKHTTISESPFDKKTNQQASRHRTYKAYAHYDHRLAERQLAVYQELSPELSLNIPWQMFDPNRLMQLLELQMYTPKKKDKNVDQDMIKRLSELEIYPSNENDNNISDLDHVEFKKSGGGSRIRTWVRD